MIPQDDLPGPNEPRNLPPACDGGEHCRLATIAENEFHNRRRRDSLIGHDIFAEPAWDMLLLLYVEHHRGQAVAAERLCASAAVAVTTALRWIGLLVETGLVMQSLSPTSESDARISLTAQGVEEMEGYLRDTLYREQLGGETAAGLHRR